ncbi:YheU family protein [Gynuella sp.]|uniref:YheU family protein n=1 Tax=Gynuella sp. TaxID=2969146 RepID=UPI003D0E87FA
MIIPYEALPAETLTALLEAFVVQEGADQFDTDYTLLEKVDQVRQQLQNKQVYIVFDPLTETCNVVTSDEAKELLREERTDL